MTPERHQQIKRLFLAAVELAPTEAQQLLDSACGKDHALRDEVQSLLNHHRPETLIPQAAPQDTARFLAATDPAVFAAAAPTSAKNAALPLPAGTIIADRYRLVARLGGGGMGVVYRAEDIELNQTVALKFLRPALQEAPEAVELLRSEVRSARQVTHPSVVRVFDIGTADGHVFISMEFVAGETLQSLVRRIGPLPPAKVLQIARQSIAGLAATHRAGIFHRDLKPGNVMIDGAGDVRILDFGIAAAFDDEQALQQLAGTPGFVAPELLAGQPPSVCSDLYAWGLVVIYAATGQLPGAQQTDPIEDRLLTAGIDPGLAAAVSSCLEADPARRPQSSEAILATLRPTDLLREAIEAGHVPEPRLVAAASSWAPANSVLNGLFAAGLALLILVMLLGDRTLFLSRCGLVKSPVALREIAEQALVRLGHPARHDAVQTGITLDIGCLQFVRAHPKSPSAWERIARGEIPAVRFWYRQGDWPLPPPNLLGDGGTEQRSQPLPGSAVVCLDGRGKLLALEAALLTSDAESAGPVDWLAVFELAGLTFGTFHEVELTRWPPLFADEVRAWVGPLPADPDFQLQVTAASLRGRVVFFEIVPPWRNSRTDTTTAAPAELLVRREAWKQALFLVVLGVAVVLAWRHIAVGHADWRGAWLVTASVLALASIDWLFGSQHSLVLTAELAAAVAWLQSIVLAGAVAGIAFLAVEPSARRWWPWSIITLRRLLDGRWNDRGIWSDILLGLVVGIGSVGLRQLCTLLNQVLGVPVSGLNDFDPSQNLLDSFGIRYKFSIFITALLLAVIQSLLILTLVVALKKWTKSTRVTAVLLVGSLAVLAILGRGILSPIDWFARLLLWSIATWVLLRFGLLATMVGLATFYVVNNTPITLDWSRWYAATGLFVVFTIGALLVVSARLARSSASGAAPHTAPDGPR